ncbi:MAG: RNA ligase family protein [Gemmataceae bacterium]|nr:RNA ligase family protein [Gemmataceae bacterium]
MAFDIRRVDLGKLNSLTKYPSILTYHALGDKGVLQETVQIPFAGRVIGTEKVDGTNTRLIFCPDGAALVGSREDLLWERRDLIGNPAMGIVEAVKDTVQRLFERLSSHNQIAVYFLEVYGKNIGAAARNYTREGRVGFRLFDVVFIDNFEETLRRRSSCKKCRQRYSDKNSNKP